MIAVNSYTADVLEGKVGIDSWDDEELWEGRRRGKDGKFSAIKPKVVPAECHTELVRRKLSWAQHEFAENLTKAVGAICDIASDTSLPPGDRLKAATYITDRLLGKAPERVQVMQVEAPWQRALNLAIVGSLEQAVARNASQEPLVVEGEAIEDAEIIEDEVEGEEVF